jgi:hypothetical protein
LDGDPFVETRSFYAFEVIESTLLLASRSASSSRPCPVILTVRTAGSQLAESNSNKSPTYQPTDLLFGLARIPHWGDYANKMTHRIMEGRLRRPSVRLFRSKEMRRAELSARSERMWRIMAVMRAHEERGALANSQELRERLKQPEGVSDARYAEFLDLLEAWVPERFMGIK